MNQKFCCSMTIFKFNDLDLKKLLKSYYCSIIEILVSATIYKKKFCQLPRVRRRKFFNERFKRYTKFTHLD